MYSIIMKSSRNEIQKGTCRKIYTYICKQLFTQQLIEIEQQLSEIEYKTCHEIGIAYG